MASAVLATRNEKTTRLTTPQPRSSFMGKVPYLNNNPNPNPNSNRKQFPSHPNNGDQFVNHHPTASDDASSFNHYRQVPASTSVADVGGTSLSHYVSFDISSLSRYELRTLKTRLMSELDRVRSLSGRIDSGDLRNPKKRPMPFQQPNKDQKRFALCSNGKQPQPQPQPQQTMFVSNPQAMRTCLQVLTKLMKHKAGYVFNSPVDVVGLGLHDYHQIISKPMDLGTIKTNLNKNLYHTPDEFAADVRLTFNNALVYNPKGHEVHILAQQFLEKFEQLFRPVYHKYHSEKQQQLRHHHSLDNRPQEDDVVVVDDDVQGSSWIKNSSPEMTPKMLNPIKSQERSIEILPRLEPQSRVKTPSPPPPPLPQLPAPVVAPPPSPPRIIAPAPVPVPESPVKGEQIDTPVKAGQVGRGSTGKLPKPKAKDPNKREMNAEEKHKLGIGLSILPEEKMHQVIQIIKKRNGDFSQDGDEIELDMMALDTETLWELDRLVTNYKKMVSKIRRQGLIGFPNNNVDNPSSNQASVSERMVRKGGDVGEEDLDIGDEMPVNNYPPLEIEKDEDRPGGGSSSSSSSSSSGSDSSSSSGSDSRSSSGSDSDVDDAQSRDNESKNVDH